MIQLKITQKNSTGSSQPDESLQRTHKVLQHLKTNQHILDQGLKSTSLIIKTMRSANQFDDAMRHLNILVESVDDTVNQTVLEDDCNRNHYNSYDQKIFLPFRSSQHSRPVAAPRIKDNPHSNTVSHQLSQLRGIYDLTLHEEDTTDEEVKSYFRCSNSDSGPTWDSSSIDEEKSSEWSGSWSRLKEKKTNLKFKTENDGCQKRQEQKEEQTSERQYQFSQHQDSRSGNTN